MVDLSEGDGEEGVSDDAYLSWFDKLVIVVCSLALVLTCGTALLLLTLVILWWG
jgi:hypothetical protein